MVDLTILQPISWFAASIGVLIAAIYYTLTLRTNQRNAKMTLENRQIQALLEFNQAREGINLPLYTKFMNAEWENFEDFYEKYGPKADPELFNFMINLWNRYNISGLMIRDGLIGVSAYIEYLGDAPANSWGKYHDIITEYRKRFHLPNYLIGFEYLANEINKYRVEKGWGSKIPDVEPAVLS
jgi:hypothetical protein